MFPKEGVTVSDALDVLNKRVSDMAVMHNKLAEQLRSSVAAPLNVIIMMIQ